MIIWVLCDHRPGTANQALAVAESLGLPFELKNIDYSCFAKLPNSILCALNIFSKNCLALMNPEILNGPSPHLIISAGRRAAYVAAWIKRRSPKTKIAQIMDPGFCYDYFDLLAIPAHDNFRSRHKNIVRTIGNPHRLTPEKLSDAKQQWQNMFAVLPSPRIGVLLGGESKGRGLTEGRAVDLLQQANNLAAKYKASLLISSSRRTPQSIAGKISSLVSVPYYFYDWQSGGNNPYVGILASAEAVIVSGDSTGMITEACGTGKPIYIYSPKGMVPVKHERLHRQLINQNQAYMLDDSINFLASKSMPSAASDIVAVIRKSLLS
ncbi:MAG: nucleoside-diphosphate sugar epimerase [Alphaproteobacteria bacterium]|nr:MAG: nucleoside-diphosphate sugar epimerase [Alphaproteobacteria bacterium]